MNNKLTQFITHKLLFTNYKVKSSSLFRRVGELAFTLAETFVVAALTLPNLNSSTGDKEKVVKLQKLYQNLEDAFGRAQAIYGPINEWCSGISNNTDCSKKYVNRLSDFLKITKKSN